MTRSNNSQGIFLMLGASVAFAVMAAATKWLGSRLPASEVVFVRSLFSVFFLLFYFLKKGGSGWPGNKPRILALRGIIGFIALILYFWAIPRIHLGTAIMLNYTAPLFAVVGSYFIFKEKSSAGKNTLILLAFFGVSLIALPEAGPKSLPFLAALASGFLAGLVHLLIRRSSDEEEESPLLIIFYFTAVCTIASLVFMPWGNWRWPLTDEWLIVLVITLSSFVGQIGLTYALQKAPVSVVSPFGYITPVLGMLLGRCIWKENPEWISYFGGAVIIVSGMLLYRKQASADKGLLLR